MSWATQAKSHGPDKSAYFLGWLVNWANENRYLLGDDADYITTGIENLKVELDELRQAVTPQHSSGLYKEKGD